MFVYSTTKFDSGNYNKELWFIDYSTMLDINDLPGEKWKDIIINDLDFTGYYQESNYGRTKSLERCILRNDGKRQTIYTKILKPNKDTPGYYQVRLSNGKNSIMCRVHILVAETFVKNDDPEHKIYINHKDENKLNNCQYNLEWCTPKYNVNYGTATQRRSKTMKRQYKNNTRPLPIEKIPVMQIDLNGNFIKEWESATDAERELGYSQNCIGNCCRGYKNTAQGFFWIYKKDYTKENIEKRLYIYNNNQHYTQIIQLSLDGKVINNFKSIKDTQIFGYNHKCVFNCCFGQAKTYKGFIWMYKEKYEKIGCNNIEKYIKEYIKDKHKIKIVQLSLNGEFVKIWESGKETKKYGYNPTRISECCKNKREQHKGYKWTYLSDYEKLNN